MQKVKTAYYELEGTHYEIGRQMAVLLGKDALHVAPIEHITDKDVEDALALYDTYCPGLTDELRGFSDENGIPIRDNLYTWMNYLVPRCSSLALLPQHTENGHILLARNYEFGIDEEDFHVYRLAPKGKYAHVGGSIIEFGRTEGINECGLAVSMSSCGFPVSNIPAMRAPAIRGLNFFAVLRTLLENCKDVAEALEQVKKMPIAYNINLMMADRSQRIALVETMNGEMAIRTAGGKKEDSVIEASFQEPSFLCATNHIVIEAFQNREPMAMRNSLVRYDSLKRFVHSSDKKTEQQIKDFLLTKYPEGMTAWHFSDWFGTVKSVVIDVNEGRFSICWGGRAENGWEDFYVDQKLGNRSKDIEIQNEPGKKDFFEFIPLS